MRDVFDEELTVAIPNETMREIVFGGPPVDDDDELIERAWNLISQPNAEAVLELFADGRGGVCRRAMSIFELATQVAAMHGGSLVALRAAWRRGQLFAPARCRVPINKELQNAA